MADDTKALTGEKAEKAPEKRRTALAVVIGVPLALFAVLNLDEVEVNWIVSTAETPLIIVIAISMLLGAGLGWLAARRD